MAAGCSAPSGAFEEALLLVSLSTLLLKKRAQGPQRPWAELVADGSKQLLGAPLVRLVAGLCSAPPRGAGCAEYCFFAVAGATLIVPIEYVLLNALVGYLESSTGNTGDFVSGEYADEHGGFAGEKYGKQLGAWLCCLAASALAASLSARALAPVGGAAVGAVVGLLSWSPLLQFALACAVAPFLAASAQFWLTDDVLRRGGPALPELPGALAGQLRELLTSLAAPEAEGWPQKKRGGGAWREPLLPGGASDFEPSGGSGAWREPPPPSGAPDLEPGDPGASPPVVVHRPAAGGPWADSRVEGRRLPQEPRRAEPARREEPPLPPPAEGPPRSPPAAAARQPRASPAEGAPRSTPEAAARQPLAWPPAEGPPRPLLSAEASPHRPDPERPLAESPPRPDPEEQRPGRWRLRQLARQLTLQLRNRDDEVWQLRERLTAVQELHCRLRDGPDDDAARAAAEGLLAETRGEGGRLPADGPPSPEDGVGLDRRIARLRAKVAGIPVEGSGREAPGQASPPAARPYSIDERLEDLEACAQDLDPFAADVALFGSLDEELHGLHAEVAGLEQLAGMPDWELAASAQEAPLEDSDLQGTVASLRERLARRDEDLRELREQLAWASGELSEQLAQLAAAEPCPAFGWTDAGGGSGGGTEHTSCAPGEPLGAMFSFGAATPVRWPTHPPRGAAAAASLLAAAEQAARGAGEAEWGLANSRRAAPQGGAPADDLDQRIASLQSKLGLPGRSPGDLEACEVQSVIEDFLSGSAPSEESARRASTGARWHPGGGGFWPTGR